MPRPLLRSQVQAANLAAKAATPRERSGSSGTVSLLKRSPRFMQAIGRLDTGQLQEADLAAVFDAITEEYGIGDRPPVGLVSKCFLGEPFEVHIVDLVGQIVEHFHRGESMPHPYERARRLSAHPAYVYIEVYEDVLVCVRADGSVTEVR